MKKWIWVVLLVLLLLGWWVVETYSWAPQRSYQSGKKFSITCQQLTKKLFNFKNIASLGGFTDLNGHEVLTEDYVARYRHDPRFVSKVDGKIRIYQEAWFKGPSIKYSWICEITPNFQLNIIASASAKFVSTD